MKSVDLVEATKQLNIIFTIENGFNNMPAPEGSVGKGETYFVGAVIKNTLPSSRIYRVYTVKDNIVYAVIEVGKTRYHISVKFGIAGLLDTKVKLERTVDGVCYI